MVNVNKHILVPVHTKLSDAQRKKIFETYSITVRELPKITKDDPAINSLQVKVGDVIVIERESQTAGKALHYRVVIDE